MRHSKVILVVIIVILTLYGLDRLATGWAEQHTRWVEHRSSGEYVWDIARQGRQLWDMDQQDVVFEIMEHNNLKDTYVPKDKTITIPVWDQELQ